jgi:hypothetical protein
VHDALGLSIVDDAQGYAVQREMVEAVPLLVPVVVDYKRGRSYGTVTSPE